MARTDTVFKALADPSRRKLLDLLYASNGRTEGTRVGDREQSCQGCTPDLVGLGEAKPVAHSWGGREKLHFLNPGPLYEIYERWIAKFERSRLRALRDLKRRLEGKRDG